MIRIKKGSPPGSCSSKGRCIFPRSSKRTGDRTRTRISGDDKKSGELFENLLSQNPAIQEITKDILAPVSTSELALKETLETYFQVCSIMSNNRLMSVIMKLKKITSPLYKYHNLHYLSLSYSIMNRVRVIAISILFYSKSTQESSNHE